MAMISRNQLLQDIQQQSQHRPLLIVAIDGYAGAGKSTLAAWLAAHLVQCQIICLDDFYRPLSSEQQVLLQAEEAVQAYLHTADVVAQILAPLREGRQAVWQALDWLSQSWLPRVPLQPQGVILLEGVFSTHASFQPWLDNSVLVTADPQTRSQRVLARPQADTAWVAHWQATEDWFHHVRATPQSVDWLVAGDSY
ncbi:MAG TPA: hypothetical protein DE179_02770 [Oceanospirillaceae bacterium]|nr:hypothetical protein [Oceanospirillaceae bacterium]